jgi:MFS family permease
LLLRFSLYGFLKNQQYYEPFIMLALLDKGHSFFAIGILFAIREITAILLEVPSGAVADLYGRRGSLILSFSAYIVSFLLLASQQSFALLSLAMMFFGTGQAFRTGTHKAMIMEWLEAENRLTEKTMVYGYTRSWSKAGSAISALIAMAVLFFTANYSSVFYLSVIPYLAGIINFFGYPAYLDGNLKSIHGDQRIDTAHGADTIQGSDFPHTTDRAQATDRAEKTEVCVERESLKEHLLNTIKTVRDKENLRKLLIETMSLDGAYKSLKDYIQPLLKSAAITIPVFTSYGADKRSILLIGAVYFIFHLLESFGSRMAHFFRNRYESEDEAARAVWLYLFFIYLIMLTSLWFNWMVPAILTFVGAGIWYNIWRPIQVGRYHHESTSKNRATILSIESQGQALSAAILTPLAGFLIDHSGLIKGHINGELWPAVIIPLLFCIFRLAKKR